MKRCLYVKNNIVQNVVGFDDAVVLPSTGDNGEDVVLDPTGLTNVGDAFDQRDTRLDRMDMVIFKELHRMNNLLRGLEIPAKAALTGAQYRTFLKTLI